MEFLKEFIDQVTIPAFCLDILGWLIGILLILTAMIGIDQALQKLTKKHISFASILKFILMSLKESIRLPSEVQPINLHRNIRKFFSYLIVGAWGYGVVIFLIFFTLLTCLLILKGQNLPIEKSILAVGMIFMCGWASKFAYIEMRVALIKTKSIV